ncbi:MAG: NAD-dependent epimerase/dehydratase family protein [Ignavibacteriaceae bacterium]
MKIFIIGGTGFLSSRLTKKLLEKGHKVTLFNRGKTKNNFNNSAKLKIINGDRTNYTSLNNAVKNKTFDIVYDMIAYNENESLEAVNIFKDKIGRFIHCSTVSVYMISDDLNLPITEDQHNKPLMEYFPRNPFGMDYGINKRNCERVLWENHNDNSFPISMLRPTFISGPGDPAKRDYFWIERILDGGPLLVPGEGNYKFQQVLVDDAADAFVKIIETDKSIGQAYSVASEDVMTLNEYLQKLMNLLNKTEPFHISQKSFDELDISYSNEGDVFPFNTRRNAVFSLEKIKKDLNYSSTPFNEWMPETIDWFINKYQKHSNGYENRDKELNIINEKILRN